MAVYWVGQDGNLWVKDNSGTNNYGSAANWNIGDTTASVRNPAGNQYAQAVADGPGAILGNRIADPVAAASPAPAGGSSAPAKVFNQAGAHNTQATIDQIPGLLAAALASEDVSHNNVIGGFNAAESTQRGNYDTGTTTNQQNYDSNFMDSIRAGIKGLGGLMALLRGTGASGGTAEDLARDTVGGTTASDIRGGKDTRDENQGALDSSLASFLTDLKTKRTAAEDTYANNRSAISRDSNTQLQDLFGKMAGFYGDVGDTADANSWMARAGGLTPAIAAASKTRTSPYDQTPVVIHAPNLTAFAAPTQPNVEMATDGQVGSGIFTMGDTRKRKDTTQTPPVALPAGV